ncbi:TIR domain-containing protein [Spirosoma sp. HMF4905]|uniref:TIR domain-containing protein n=1 Tax=Spirosoma arboris TaxID=2682092 RepID=A0A7K1SMM2_9BACT|nr:toll/interleukin-1 receptor domain-containing protein [Spirosoma arboris]MVM34856.1 TIR domain-containing protein [Spirosoma arboris]
MSTSNLTLFVSYSHEDEAVIKPLVDLLRTKEGLVFFDRDSILAGDEWNPKILSAIDSCDKFIVFWSIKSAESFYVEKEFTRAINDKKTIIPILLDGTELPQSLARFQWIDLEILTKNSSRKIKIIWQAIKTFVIKNRVPISRLG